ncbi:MAG: ATP-binding protein, partial [Planctomycetota bacterium]|nr:ATP-binding protein [Planctomycetota bacterium]
VSNAIKFTSRGDVHVAVDLAQPPAEGDKPELRISVTDSGVGMNPEQIALLFQPFQRVHRDTLQVGGTGLGLAISKRLAELMGGRIEIESTPEIGTKFTFVLPMDQAPESELESSTSSSGLERHTGTAGTVDTGRNLQGLKVLVVDDNNDNVSIFTHLLEPLGVHVTVATNGQQAVDTVEAYFAAGNPFQVILMDMQMPILDGFQATALLRKRGVKTPVVALTAFAMQADQERCRQAGCDLFLAKPVRRQTLVATLVQAADLAARLSDTAALQAEVNASRPAVIEQPNSISIHYREQAVATDATPTPATVLDTPLLTEKTSPPPVTEAFTRLLAQYRNSLRRYLKSIEEAEANGDTDEISHTTHRLKGTGTNYGFPKITEIAGAVEDRLRSGGTMKDIHADLSVLKRLIRDVIGD